jgi:hypothetical protein
MLVIVAEFPVADADADPVAETLPGLLPELPHAAVSAARERAPTAVRVRRPARMGIVTLLIPMISGDRWLASGWSGVTSGSRGSGLIVD